MKLIDIRREEWPAFLWSFAYFFCLLCAYYVLRPVRDEMGIQGGLGNLKWLWTAVFFGMLLMTPLFGWISSRWPRRKFLPAVYIFFIANILFFFVAMKGVFNIDITHTAMAFYVWISVFNYFVVSVFWSFMTDIFDSARAKRLFGAIASGGSLGAIVGPIITATLVAEVGVPNLLLISAALMGLAIGCVIGLGRWASNHPADVSNSREADLALGGGLLDGIKLAFQSPYLLSISAYIMLMQSIGTFFYLEQLGIMARDMPSSADRTELFALLDLAVNVITVVTQLFFTSALLQRVGLVFCLTLLPAMGAILLGATGFMPTLIVVSVSTVLRRSTEFAISKPAREVLFTVVSRPERYKAKNVIDTIVTRTGDLISNWAHAGLRGLGFTTAPMAFATIPLALCMFGAGWYLGRSQEKRQAGVKVVSQT